MATFSNFKSTLVAAADTAAGASAAATTIVADMTALIALTGMSDGDQAFVTANNNLYFYSSGWYKIATVSNDSPSSITGVSGSYALDISGGTTVITAVSTDPEGFPLTWSYSTTGLGSIATISQASNVFTITPSTNIANAGSFTLTISVTDGVNGAVSTSSTLTLQFIVTNSNYTTRLVTATDTGDNNNITDASSNSYTITATGDTAAGTFSPYRHGGYSVYFDGNGDYLTPNSSAMNIGLGTEFTIEGWFYFTDIGGTAYDMLFGTGNTYYIGYRNNNNTLEIISSTNTIFDVSGGLNNNTWYHITIVRNSSNIIKAWINGVELSVSGGGSSTNNIALALTTIGRSSSYTTHDFKGYMRDIRFTNTTVYTSAFTPPTEPLTAISGTSLLTCHLPYIADGSSNNYTITPSGNVKTEARSPYNNSAYSVNSNGGSVYFDGSGDYLTIPSLGNNTVTDLTISFWVYPETSSVSPSLYPRFLTIGGASTSNGFIIYLRDDNTIRFYSNGERIQSSTISLNTWQHVVLKRNSGTWRMLINGVSQGTYTDSTTMNFTASTMYVGRDSGTDGYTKGYISDLKIEFSSDSSTSVTVPTAPISSSGATLHIKGTDAAIIDKAQGTNLIIPSSGVSGSTTQVKFASTKSIYFTGGSSAGVDLGTNLFLDALNTEYTLEMWYYPTQTGTNSFLMSSYIDTSTGRWLLYQQGSDSRIRFFANLNGTKEIYTSAVSANNWYHVAVVRKSNGYMSIFLNGTETELTTDVSGYATVLDRPVLLGSGDTFSTSGCQGYIQDVRITKGLARYTSNFTPPTSELQG